MRLALPCLALFAAGCLCTAREGPDPALAAETARLAETRGSHVERAPRSDAPRPWHAGQWALYRRVDASGTHLVRYSVVGEGTEGLWLETAQLDARTRFVQKQLYARWPRGPGEVAKLLVRGYYRRGGGPVREVDYSTPAGQFAKQVAQETLDAGLWVPVDVRGRPRERAVTPAGTFDGCVRYQSTGFGRTLDVWWHPAVPIHGTVKAESTSHDWSYELLDYGETGAASEVPGS